MKSLSTVSETIYRTKWLCAEDNSVSLRQTISRHLWNPRVHYRVQKSLPLDSILCQLIPVRTLFLRDYF
jgi:hypothetical protein